MVMGVIATAELKLDGLEQQESKLNLLLKLILTNNLL